MRSATDRPALESGHETRIEPGSPGRRRRRVLTGSGRRRALTALAAVVAALAGCTAPQPPGPTPTAAPPTPTAGPPTPTSVPPATLPPLPADLGPARGVFIPPTPTAPA